MEIMRLKMEIKMERRGDWRCMGVVLCWLARIYVCVLVLFLPL